MPPKFICDFIDWLNAKNLTDTPCQFIFYPNERMMAFPGTEEFGKAVYIWGDETIVIAGDASDVLTRDGKPTDEEFQRRFLMFCVAHEYLHHVQWVESGGKAPEKRSELDDSLDKRDVDLLREYLGTPDLDFGYKIEGSGYLDEKTEAAVVS